MTPADQSLDHTFTAPIEKDGSYPTFVTVPGSPTWATRARGPWSPCTSSSA